MEQVEGKWKREIHARFRELQAVVESKLEGSGGDWSKFSFPSHAREGSKSNQGRKPRPFPSLFIRLDREAHPSSAHSITLQVENFWHRAVRGERGTSDLFPVLYFHEGDRYFLNLRNLCTCDLVAY